MRRQTAGNTVSLSCDVNYYTIFDKVCNNKFLKI